MKKRTIITIVLSTVLLTAILSAGTPMSASSRQPVMGFIDFDEAGQQFLESKNLMEEYQADAEYYNGLLKPLEDEIVRMRNAGEENSKSYQLKVNEYSLQKDKFTTQLQEKYTVQFEKVNEKLLKLAEEYAKINDIDILLTNKVAVYITDDFDLTEDFIEFANSRADF
ncbi:MAG: OmpH family outer membrane protein [Thermotogota bacterium]